MSNTKSRTFAFEDVIYGPQIEKRSRAQTHLKRLEGVMHLSRRSPLIAKKGEPIRLTVTTSGDKPFRAVTCRYRIDGRVEKEVVFNKGEVSWDDLAWTYVRYWYAEIPAVEKTSEVVYRIGADIEGEADSRIYADNQTLSIDEATIFSISTNDQELPAWSSDAVIYHIFIDRFNPGRNKEWLPATSLMDFFGGTLQGIIEKLDYIKQLDFNTIWLSPVFASPTHHGYDATDLLNVEPRLGTNEDLDNLIQQAHSKGMRIILDFVPNHWSNQHPTFIDARQNEDSAYRDWYIWNHWPDDYEAYFGLNGMPKLNLHAGSPAREHLLDVARYWLGRGVDGFRLDHAEGPPQDFWVEFRNVCQQANPDAWLFGEIVRPPNVLKSYAGGMHGCLDFALTRALRQTFALQNWSLERFEAFLGDHENYFPENFSTPAFIDNHDMNRFFFISGEDKNKLKLALLVLYALRGAPIVYYGTERGISQDRSTGSDIGLDEARKPIIWTDEPDHTFLDYFPRLAHARAQVQFDLNPRRQVLLLDSEKNLYAFAWLVDGRATSVIVVNGSDIAQELLLNIAVLPGAKDIVNNCEVAISEGELRVQLAPMSGAFISEG